MNRSMRLAPQVGRHVTELSITRLLPSHLIGRPPGSGDWGPSAGASRLPIALGDPGTCALDGTTVAIILDESASVTAGDGNDPLSRRHAETDLAISHVAAACHCGRDRVAVVPFDTGSPGHVAPQALTRAGVRRLHRGLERLADGWGMSSDLGPALDCIDTQVRRQPGNLAVVVFSDFLLTDANPTSVLRRLCAVPGYVHAVVLGAQPPAVLVSDPNVAVTRLTPISSPGTAARAVFDGLTRFRTYQSPDLGSAARHSHETLDSEGELIS
ncbi:hypothetical protein [Mycobacterium sp. C31M]